MGVTYSGRVEALINVPSGVSVSATNSGGGPTSVGLTAGSYFMTAAGSVSGLLATLKSALNSSRAPSVGAWDVSLSPSTGLVTIDCTSGAKLTKSGGVNAAFDAGAASNETITADGFVEITVGALSQAYMIGLSANNPDVNYTSVDFGLYFDGAALKFFENGVEKWNVGTTYAVGDVMRVNRTGTTVTALKNGTVLYTSATASTGSLIADISMATSSGVMSAIRLANVSGSTATYSTITWQNSTNVTASSTTFSVAWTSTALRDVLGFAADISSVSSPQTGTLNPRGVWLPDMIVNVETSPKRAPMVSDLRTTQGPTGVVYGLSGNTFLRHRSVVWPHVPKERTWESDATVDYASWEWFFKETQLGLGSSWFNVASLVQIYAHDGTLVGSDANSGAGTDGWSITGATSIEPKPSVDGWDNRWRIEIPQLVSSG